MGSAAACVQAWDPGFAFSTSIKAVLRLADRALEQQQRLAADEYDAVASLWKQIDLEVVRLDGARDDLSNAARSVHP